MAEVKGQFCLGTGTWDDKGNLMSQMEASGMLSGQRLPARRTVYLAFWCRRRGG